MSPRNLRKPYVYIYIYIYSLMYLFYHYPLKFLSFFFLPSLHGFLFLKECISQFVKFIYDILFSLVNKFKGLASGSYHKYAGFFLEWHLYVKNAIITNPIWLVPISIAGWYVWYYIAWAWQVGWWLAFIIVRARFLACLNHTVRLI